LAETFELEVAGPALTLARSAVILDGTIGEIFLNNHKSNSAADVKRPATLRLSPASRSSSARALKTIRHALCRDSQGRASGPLGAALDRIANEGAT